MAQNVEAQIEPTFEWDNLPAVIRNNLELQHREGGLEAFTLPAAKLVMGIAVDPYTKVVKAIQAKIKDVDAKLMKASKVADFRQLIEAKRSFLAELAEAKDARTAFRGTCEHVATVNTLNKIVKASRYTRLNQVIDLMGPLAHEEIQAEDADMVAGHQAYIEREKKLRALRGL